MKRVLPDLLLEVDDLHVERVSEKNAKHQRCYICGEPSGAFLASRGADKRYRIPVHQACAKVHGLGRAA